MLRVAAFFFGLLFVMNTGHADVVQDCVSSKDPDTRIKGCTIALKRNTLTQEHRAAGHSNRGMGFYDKGDYDRSISDYDKAIEINPRNAFAYNNRCLSYHKKGDHDRAIADCSKSIELKNPALAVPYTGRGDAYAAKGDYDRAAADYARAIELNPAYDRAHQAVAALAKLRALNEKQPGAVTALDAKPANQTKIEIVQLVPHSDWVESVAFSPDGRFLLSGSKDGKAKVWDAKSGRLVRTLRGHPGGITSVAFSSDGSRVATGGSSEASVKLWDLRTGDFTRFFVGHTKQVTTIAFSPDGKRIVSGSYDNAAKMWDADTGKLLLNFQGHVGSVISVAFSPDGTRVISGSGTNLHPQRVDNTAKIWDSATGKVIRSLTHPAQVASVAFSNDGRRVLTGSDDNTMRLWDANSGLLIRAFGGYSYPVYSVAFSPDGGSVLSGNIDGIKLWDGATGALKRVFGGAQSIRSVAFSADGTRVVSGSMDKTVQVWDVGTGRALLASAREGDSSVPKPTAATFSPDGARIVSGSYGDMWFWDLPNSARTFDGDHQHLAYSPDGARVLVGGDNALRLVDAASGRPVHTFSNLSNHVSAIAFSPDGTRVLAGLGNDRKPDGAAPEKGKIKMWNASTGQLLTTFRGHGGGTAAVAFNGVNAVIFSPDGTRVVTGGEKDGVHDKVGMGKIRFWDPATGQLVRNIDAHYLAVTALAFSSDGSRMVSGSSYDQVAQGILITEIQTVRIWDVKSGQLLHSAGPYAAVNSVAFSPDGRWVLSGSSDNQLMLWDAATGQLARTFDGHSGSVTSVSFSRDGRRILSASADGSIRVWDAQTGELLATLMGEKKSWLAMMPLGFFATSSPTDAKPLTIVRGLELYDINQMYQALYGPDLLREKLVGDPDGEVKKAALNLDLEKVIGSGPAPEVALISPVQGETSNDDVVTVSARVLDHGGGVGRIEWRVNGVTAAVVQSSAEPALERTITQAIALESGENTVEVVAYNARNLMSSLPARATLTFTGAADDIKPNLHVLAIGINSYVDDGWTPPGGVGPVMFSPLNLAVNDAKAFAAGLRAAGVGQYGAIRITLSLDSEATIAGLERAIERIAAEIHPRDTFVLFAAAHGFSDNGRFYLIPQDYQGGTNADALKRNAIGQERLQDWIGNRIKAKKAILLLDTCESGALVGGQARLRSDEAASEAAVGRLHEATGRPILTAAASGQPAFEGYKGHGVFTWALLDGMRNADRNGNGTIELSELVAHVQGLVPKLSAELNGKGRAAIAVRGLTDESQSARFGSRGEDFPLVRRLQ